LFPINFELSEKKPYVRIYKHLSEIRSSINVKGKSDPMLN